jgi:hypothetical protein
MTALKDLELHFDPRQQSSLAIAHASFGMLASRLTALELRTTRCFDSMLFLKGHPIKQLYGLRKLKLPRGATLAVEMLADWPDLRQLELQDVRMMAPCGSLPTLPPAAVFDPGNPDLAALLAQLQQHTQVTGSNRAKHPGSSRRGCLHLK